MAFGPKKIVLAAVAGLTVAAVLGAHPAWAASTITLDPAQLPATAAAHHTASTEELGGCAIGPSPSADHDIWVFHVQTPAGPTGTGDPIVSGPAVTVGPSQSPAVSIGALATLSATFDDATALPETITVAAAAATDVGAIAGNDAWLAAPAGSVLIAASAEVTGDGGTLELVTACPAEPAASRDSLAGLAPRATATTPALVATATTPAPHPGPKLETLPVAGTDVAQIATLGAGLVLTGVLLILARGRRPRPVAEPEEDDIRQPVIMSRRL